MIIVRLLSPSLPGWFWRHQVYSGLGAGIVMESISLTTRRHSVFDEGQNVFVVAHPSFTLLLMES